VSQQDHDETKWKIPERFRAGLDTEAARERLAAADQRQAELGNAVENPIAAQTPRERARVKARIELDTLLKIEAGRPLTDDEAEQQAEHWATLGHYDLAAAKSKIQPDEYWKIWTAVHLPDEDWCEHHPKHNTGPICRSWPATSAAPTTSRTSPKISPPPGPEGPTCAGSLTGNSPASTRRCVGTARA
jgi:hypothetical protein